MRNKVIGTLLAMAVGGGAFSIVRGAPRRRAVGAPRATHPYMQTNLHCVKVETVSNGAKFKGVIYFDGEGLRELRFHNGIDATGNIPVHLWRSRGGRLGVLPRYCAVHTFELPPVEQTFFFDLPLDGTFIPGDYACIEGRPYNVSAEMCDGRGREAGRLHMGYINAALFQYRINTADIYDCTP